MILTYNKKGQGISLVYAGLAVIFISISMLITTLIVSNYTDSVTALTDSEGNFTFSEKERNYLSNTQTNLPKVFDYSFGFFVVVSTVALVSITLFMNANILFFGISAASFIFIILGNAIFANLIDSVGNSVPFANIYSQFPIMSFFADNWLTYTVVVGFLLILAFFGGKNLR